MSVGFGIFISMAPVWGFQLLIAIGVSIWFRLNKALVLLATNFSIPPLIPVILYVSHEIGAFWMRSSGTTTMTLSTDMSYDMLGEGLLQYVAGAITLSAGSGVVAGLTTYFLLTYFREKNINGKKD